MTLITYAACKAAHHRRPTNPFPVEQHSSRRCSRIFSCKRIISSSSLLLELIGRVSVVDEQNNVIVSESHPSRRQCRYHVPCYISFTLIHISQRLAGLSPQTNQGRENLSECIPSGYIVLVLCQQFVYCLDPNQLMYSVLSCGRGDRFPPVSFAISALPGSSLCPALPCSAHRRIEAI